MKHSIAFSFDTHKLKVVHIPFTCFSYGRLFNAPFLQTYTPLKVPRNELQKKESTPNRVIVYIKYFQNIFKIFHLKFEKTLYQNVIIY